ncbi:MAG: phycocyanobilin:ferredoxin oxidoreductase [Cyanobacteria bacterium J06621_3]
MARARTSTKQSPTKKETVEKETTSLKQSLQHQQHPLINRLAELIKSIWQSQLMIFPYNTPTDLGYVEGSLEGEQLTIENTCYQTFQFRKLHLELAKVGKHLDILHCVMFPHPCYDLPIFGVDIVAARGTITAAIVDLSPVSSDRSFPAGYDEVLSKAPAYDFTHARDLPEWGSIFSDYCLFVSPKSPEEERAFLNQAIQYLSLHCQLACEAIALDTPEDRSRILAGQRHYCLQQQKNDKTRRILERAFDKEWAQRYLQTMLFDTAPDVEAAGIPSNI